MPSRIKRKGNVFKRLDDLADLFVDAGYPDVRTLVSGGVWLRLQESWATRHVFTHNDGVIDDKFVSKVPGRRSSASALESLSRCVVRPSRTYAPSVPLSPVSRHRARRPYECSRKPGLWQLT